MQLGTIAGLEDSLWRTTAGLETPLGRRTTAGLEYSTREDLAAHLGCMPLEV
jgi:hypothetical protein